MYTLTVDAGSRFGSQCVSQYFNFLTHVSIVIENVVDETCRWFYVCEICPWSCPLILDRNEWNPSHRKV